MADEKEAVLERAIEAAGGPAALARFINDKFDQPITAQAICDWKRIPPLRVLQVEAATGNRVSRFELRPDIYPPAKARAA